jgi:hypothetical protein
MMILFPTTLNDESGLSETSVATWTISYDIGYMSSSMSRTLELWKAANSFNFGSYLKTKFDAHMFVDNQMSDLENEATQYESPNEESENARGSDEYKSPSPLHPPCGKRQRVSGTEDHDYVPEQLVYNHWKLRGMCHLLLLSRRFICILLQSN